VLAVRQCLHWINRRLGQELTVSVAGQARVIGSTVVTLLLDGRRGACCGPATAAATCGAASACTS
jgi:serine/threonine-protein phosphatase Stp1